jgi:hypothetical protein
LGLTSIYAHYCAIVARSILDVRECPLNKFLFTEVERRKRVPKRSEFASYELIGVYLNPLTEVRGKDNDAVAERKHPIVEAMEQVVRVTFGLIGEIRAANAFEKQCVTRKDCVLSELVHRGAFGMTRHAH